VRVSDPVTAGRYTVTEAARLVGLHTSTVRRWTRTSPSTRGSRSPVVRGAVDDVRLLSFLDHVELDLLRRLKERNMSTHDLIRLAAEAAGRLGVDHPFVRRGVRVEPGKRGARVYLPMAALPDREGLLQLGTAGQMALAEVIEKVSKTLDYNDADGLVQRWWPEGRDGAVVIDPLVGFGEPVVANTRINANVLRDMVVAEGGDVERVARLYELPTERVRQAVAFAQGRGERYRKRAA
jgi:uncharacterized protein (DUF433 family)